ncbi:CBS domain-containing protein [Saccharothrix sp. NPDC042600]|uniref:CBS domain-containing protein n=1 Tax=Saccharothrix TaxID=2071 RepID=UPI0033D60189|nr:hypoxic response protein Hrp1 [Saccharothrix mutabilis subsp. capreolus]
MASLKARDIMHRDVRCITMYETLASAAKLMLKLDVGALPICDNGRLAGIITDRDIVLRCVAKGLDAAKMTAADLAQGTPRWIDADADAREVVDAMGEHRVKRLPVIDTRQGNRLVGIISEADLAQHLSDHQVAEFVGKVFAPH